MLEVELYKIVDAGHFWCKPASRNRNEAEKYYTLIGKINDYCCRTEEQSSNRKTKIPSKGKICLVKRTSDRCWYRARVLSIFQTINGPHARVLLVDLGERTLVPGIWIQEIPEEFLDIPYQTMECILSELKPLTMVTSYFDLTTKKQPGETWDVSATEWFKEQITGCALQMDVKRVDDDGIHYVMLFATGSNGMICVNDELINKEYAVVCKGTLETNEGQKNASSSKERAQELFSDELKNMREKMDDSLALQGETAASSAQYQPLSMNGQQRNKYQPLTWSEDSEESGNELGRQPIRGLGFSSDEDRNKVRFMSARMPATGAACSLAGGVTKQPKPILKTSSGYSSCEDSQERFAKIVGGPVRPPSAHDQNTNVTSQRNGVSLHRNTFGSQQHAQGWGAQGEPAHHQNANLSRQSGSMGSRNEERSSLQYAQNTTNLRAISERQNTPDELPASTGQYARPGYHTSTNQQPQPLPQNYEKRHDPHFQDSEPNLQYPSSRQNPFGSSLHQPVSSHQNVPPNNLFNPPQSTHVPVGHMNPPHIPSGPPSFPRQNSTIQSTDIHQGEQSIPIQKPHYAPISTLHSQQQPRSTPQSTNVPYGSQSTSHSRLIHSNTISSSSIPKGKEISTIVPQVQQLNPAGQQSQYTPSSTSPYPNVPADQILSTGDHGRLQQNIPPGQYDSMRTHEYRNVPTDPSQSTGFPQGQLLHQQNVPTRPSQRIPTSTSNIPHVPSYHALSTGVPQSQGQQQHCPARQSQYIPTSTSEYPRVPTNQIQSTSVPKGQLQQPNLPPRQPHYTPLSRAEYPHPPTNQLQSSSVPQSPLQPQRFPQKPQHNALGTSLYQNMPVYPQQSHPPSRIQENDFPPRPLQRVPTSTLGFPHVPSNPRQSTGIPPVRHPHYGQLSSPECSNVPTNHAQSISVPEGQVKQPNFPRQLQSRSETPHERFNQAPSINVPFSRIQTASEYPSVPSSPLSQTSDIPQQSTSVHSSMAHPLGILSDLTPTQRLPTDIPNNQGESHYISASSTQHLNLYPTSDPDTPRRTSQSTTIKTRLTASQPIPSNQREFPVDPSSSTQSTTRTQDLTGTSSIPKTPVQASSIQTSPTKSPRIPSSPMPNAKLCQVSSDVLIHGEGLPRSVTEIDSNTFPDTIQRGLRDLCVTKPSSFQANIWPAIIRGRDVFGIPETSSDNVMAYLAPVATQLAEPAAYSELPLGNGALALVLCDGWRKAATVYEQCRKLTKHARNIRVQVVHGAGAENEQISHLINGCEVLVATLPCLLRMLRMKFTRLDRLCHLVFDDADILAEEQTECVKELMRNYGALLASQQNRLAPRQCIAVGNKWTPGVSSLIRAYLGNPLVVIGNQIEAAMFCKVRHIVNYVSSSKRDSELLRLLDQYTLNNEHEIIIFTSTAKTAERLSEMLQYNSFTVLLAHEFLWPEHMTEVRRQWNTPRGSTSFLILVMTDGVIDKCNIRTATCVIHYDSPPSKKLFGKRMFRMAASYPSTKEKECLSLTIGTELSTGCARSLKEMVVRSSGVVPPTLETVCELAYEEKEEKKMNDDICSNLKAFGQCKDLQQCKSRHTIFPHVDVSQLLPKSGVVKVLILAVLDASRYFVRILEHRNEKNEVNSANHYSGATFLKLALDLNSMYTSRENRRVCSRTQPLKLCVVENEGSYYRAKMIRVVRADPETNKPLEVQVYFVDGGFYEVVATHNLFEIAPQFVNIPYQAVEAYACRVKPVDNDKHWTNKAVRFVQQNIEGQEMEGKVVMGLRNTIWLDPLVAKTHLKEINVTTNTLNVRIDLMKEGLAEANQTHVESLKEHFASFVQLKDITDRQRSSDNQQIETCTLPERDYDMVRVSSIVNPELLYVRLDANSNSLEDLVDQINDDIETTSSASCEDLSIGSLCLAQFTEDKRWYRARILSIRPEREYDVFFVDYGDREWVTQDRIAPIRPDYLQFSFQAIECSLVNISPLETSWTEDDAETLWKLTEDKLLHAKVKSKSAAMLSGTWRYGIELCDTSTERDVHVNHELVVAGHAQATLEYHKTLFPEAFEANGTGRPKEQYEEIPQLCLQLYRAQDSNVKVRCAQDIKNIVSQNMKKKDEIRESGGVRCICRLLGVNKHEAVQECLVITLAFLATQNDLNCDEIRREGGLKILCDLLNKTQNVKVQEHSAWALKILATVERNCEATREFGGIKSLCNLLSSSDRVQVQENICWAIVTLCSDNNSNCDAVREAGGLTTLLTLLEKTRDKSVLENTMWAISLLTYNASNKKLIREQGGIEKICNLIKINQDEKILKNAVRSLKTLSTYDDENRDIMCRLGIIELMRRLSNAQSQLPFDTRRICLDLIQRLLGRDPDVPLIEASSITSPLQERIKCKPIAVTKRKPREENGTIVNGGAESDDDLPLLEDAVHLPSVHPMTSWSQTKRFVSLSIKLRGVQHKATNITEKSFLFRTKHLEKFYELNLELFADIVPKESKVHLRGSEVLVCLRKAQSGTWKRLLATTEKPAFLSIDFDRWNTDSGSDEEGETRRPRIPAPLTKSTTSTKRDYKMLPPPFEDDDSESSEGFSEEETARFGLEFSH